MHRWIRVDERAESIAGRLSFIFLGLTQAGLLIAIFYQRYIQGLPPAYYNDMAVVLAGSVLGFWLFSFYLGGALPALSTRSVFAAYSVLVVAVGLPHTIIRGLPEGRFLVDRLLIIFGAPAVLVRGVCAHRCAGEAAAGAHDGIMMASG